MKKIISALLTSLLIVTNCFSQDIITKKTSEDIQAKVLEVTTTEIKYKKFDFQDGPTYSIPKSEVMMIRYENGTKDIFDEEKSTGTLPASVQSGADLYLQGQKDATRYYQGYKGAGTGTLIVSLLSPLVGLIPAIACSSTQPKDSFLNYPKSDLMKLPDYRNGYTQRAKKIKQGKVWSNWGIAFGVNLIAAVLLQSGQ